MISAKAAPFAPPLNGHCQEIRAIAGLADAWTAYTDVIGFLFQCFRRKRHLIRPLISSFVMVIASDTMTNVSDAMTHASDVIRRPSDVRIDNSSWK